MKLKRRLNQAVWLILVRIALLISILFLIIFLVMILAKGSKVLSISFLTQPPKEGMTAGGIFPAILGTFYLVLLTIIVALPLGVFAAIYLSEYAQSGHLVNIIRTAINTLAGVPSIVFGLFGLAIFVNMFGFGVSILSGSLTLAILILPIIINASEEAIKMVPDSFRQAAYALGATKRQTITKVVLPTALPNILTGAIISVGRAAGETAPILFTAATFYTRKLPTSILDEVMALPYHIYALMTEGTAPKQQVPIAYGTSVVLLLLVLTVNLVAIIIRYRIRKRKKW
ncbi:MAG: phosphate ABC transporter permease PstA [candidate division WOR-3 bacterium]|nr:phosphate ABC transporter permease PstA [candidate division WOR-3 bacterium]